MNKDDTLNVINAGNRAFFNAYRARNPDWRPDLSESIIRNKSLEKFDFSSADLSHSSIFTYSILWVNFEKANLCGTEIRLLDLGAPLDSAVAVPPPDEYVIKNWESVKLSEAIFDVNTCLDRPINHDYLIAFGAIPALSVETQASDASRIRVFISYAWANDDVVLAIDTWLRSKRLQTKLDKRDFFAGSRIRDEIVRVMSECQVILIFHSKDSADKPWPEFERELAADIEMDAKKKKSEPPRIIYTIIDETPLPSISEKNRIAIVAKGKRFEYVCEEIYHAILRLPKAVDEIDLNKWSDFVF